MVAPLAAAGIAAAGSVIGGITGGKGQKKAAQIQQQTARDQIAAVERNRDMLLNLNQGTIDRGESAGKLFGDFVGLGDGAASASALDTYRGSTGYQDLLDTGLSAVNANAYARGMGDSGATLKALQRKGMAIADQSSGDWLSRLDRMIGYGQQAIGTAAGVSTNATNAINSANQNSADAQSNAALASAGGWQQAIKNLTNIGMSFGSSYGGGAQPGQVPGSWTPPYFPGGFGDPARNY
jgi:hypothetical protein